MPLTLTLVLKVSYSKHILSSKQINSANPRTFAPYWSLRAPNVHGLSVDCWRYSCQPVLRLDNANVSLPRNKGENVANDKTDEVHVNSAEPLPAEIQCLAWSTCVVFGRIIADGFWTRPYCRKLILMLCRTLSNTNPDNLNVAKQKH